MSSETVKQLQTVVLYDRTHKKLDYINILSAFAVLDDTVMTYRTQKSVCADVPDMLPVHGLKEKVRFDFIHTS